ncbi:TIR domain-containing protein [Sharpea azabuensis]|uniref:TIR domain-containing protein n=1 Tax=Sharpea porci TaxID=2652286 RepID=A0A844FVW1_9FIRM|nr:toll/interleukin-1 receptor domain-containing protein [Sharpea porci]MST89480.1 TIR domain-containing protein [Sharpea porci]
MNKIDKLKSIIGEIDQLILKRVTSSSPEFLAWKSKAERFLINEYGAESYEIDEFKEQQYDLSVYALNTPKSDFCDACISGLKRAKAILSTYLEELEESKNDLNKINAYDKLKYEFRGIKTVIENYTKGGFVTNDLYSLEQGIRTNDKDKIKYFLLRLLDWYTENWMDICDNKFVINYDDHEKNRELIKEIYEGIDEVDFSQFIDRNDCNRKSEPVIFLSHSSTDKKYGNALEKLLSGIGIEGDQLIYTSHPLHKIPLDQNIYEYLRNSFSRKIFVIVLWSDEYLNSPACLNEMGAVWVTQSDYTNIYVPSFNFKNPKYAQCAVDTNRMGAILDGSDKCKASITELKDKLIKMFDLSVDEKRWIYILDQFMMDISN